MRSSWGPIAESGVAVAGIAATFDPNSGGSRWVLYFPVHAQTTKRHFDTHVIESAARIAFWESIPPDFEVDTERPEDIQWSDEYQSPSDGKNLIVVRVCMYLRVVHYEPTHIEEMQAIAEDLRRGADEYLRKLKEDGKDARG